MKNLFFLTALIWTIGFAPLAFAQQGPGAPATQTLASDAEIGDEKSFLENLLQETLSVPGMKVNVTGLSGALSSNATIQQIEMSDANGVWLTLKNVSMIWTRLALLSSRLEIEKLTAEEIEFLRYPISEAELPTPEAGDFSLPKLPVSVDIGEISTAKMILGAPILGTAARVNFNGNLELNDDVANAMLNIQRIDDQPGQIALLANLDRQTNVAKIDLKIIEEKDGILVTFLDLPGRPSAEFLVKGEGKLSDITTTILLKTDGVERLSGNIAAKEVLPAIEENAPENEVTPPSKLTFSAQLGGDISPLLFPEYQDFFGKDVRLEFTGQKESAGPFNLSSFVLSTSALELQGSGRFSAKGFPQEFNLSGLVQHATGQPVLLPITGPKILVQSAKIFLNFGGQDDQKWRGLTIITGLNRQDFSAKKLRLNAQGTIVRNDQSDASAISAVTAGLKFATEGLAHSDPSVSQAMGTEMTGSANINWQNGQPLVLSDLKATSSDVNLTMLGRISGLETALAVEGKALVEVGDISRFSAITGQNLAGSGTLELSGKGELLTGAFDGEIKGKSHQVSIGQSRIDALLVGTSDLVLSVRRDETGLLIRDFSVKNNQVTAGVDGTVQSGQALLNLNGVIQQFAQIVPEISGDLKLNGTVKQSGDQFLIDLKAAGLGGAIANISGSVPLLSRNFDLKINGTAPLSMADQFISARNAQVRGVANIYLGLKGPLNLASLTGQVTTSAGSFFDPETSLRLNAITAQLSFARGTAQLETTATVQEGGSVTVSGPIRLEPASGYPGNLTLRLRDVRRIEKGLFATSFDGDLAMNGPLLGGATISGRIDLKETEIQVQPTAFSGTGTLPLILHKNVTPRVLGTQKRSGVTADQITNNSSAGRYPLDLLINAENKIFVRGRGLDTELSGSLRLRGNSSAVIPSGRFELIRGRLDFLGRRMDVTRGNVDLVGSLDPSLYFRAEAQTDDVDIFVTIEGSASDPLITFASNPDLPEDEVLSQLIFGRGVDQLSAFQALKLAAGVAQLTGSGGGVVGKLRGNLGLDDFDVTTNDEGNTELSFGKYLSDNVYSNVNVGSGGTSEISLNVDIRKGVTARGTVDSDGETSIGIFIEKDY